MSVRLPGDWARLVQDSRERKAATNMIRPGCMASYKYIIIKKVRFRIDG
jgi:hypothetical protein